MLRRKPSRCSSASAENEPGSSFDSVRRVTMCAEIELARRQSTPPAQKQARQYMQKHRTGQTSRNPRRRVAATMAIVAVALAFAPRWAAAQTSDIEGAPPQPSEEKQPHGIGLAISAAGGLSIFSRSSARDFLDTGGTWDVRGVFGT